MAARHGMTELGQGNTGGHGCPEIRDPKADNERDEEKGPTPEAYGEFYQNGRHSPADHSGDEVIVVPAGFNYSDKALRR
ncbi:hypothetical protein VM1G_11878 [Cytospora mali]|uniref:Uncharacterized protein n=1 Tax=Cytospora mali TaxID=578113 RepID=A0A194W9W8_CYTMA|nr:hypothetical protein VM1G_11878 [Valsa mali]